MSFCEKVRSLLYADDKVGQISRSFVITSDPVLPIWEERLKIISSVLKNNMAYIEVDLDLAYTIMQDFMVLKPKELKSIIYLPFILILECDITKAIKDTVLKYNRQIRIITIEKCSHIDRFMNFSLISYLSKPCSRCFVRLFDYPYVNDVSEVLDYDFTRKCVLIRVIPRIDYKKSAGINRIVIGESPELLSNSNVSANGLKVKKSRINLSLHLDNFVDGIQWCDYFFYQGFLIKTVEFALIKSWSSKIFDSERDFYPELTELVKNKKIEKIENIKTEEFNIEIVDSSKRSQKKVEINVVFDKPERISVEDTKSANSDKENSLKSQKLIEELKNNLSNKIKEMDELKQKMDKTKTNERKKIHSLEEEIIAFKKNHTEDELARDSLKAELEKLKEKYSKLKKKMKVLKTKKVDEDKKTKELIEKNEELENTIDSQKKTIEQLNFQISESKNRDNEFSKSKFKKNKIIDPDYSNIHTNIKAGDVVTLESPINGLFCHVVGTSTGAVQLLPLPVRISRASNEVFISKLPQVETDPFLKRNNPTKPKLSINMCHSSDFSFSVTQFRFGDVVSAKPNGTKFFVSKILQNDELETISLQNQRAIIRYSEIDTPLKSDNYVLNSKGSKLCIGDDIMIKSDGGDNGSRGVIRGIFGHYIFSEMWNKNGTLFTSVYHSNSVYESTHQIEAPPPIKIPFWFRKESIVSHKGQEYVLSKIIGTTAKAQLVSNNSLARKSEELSLSEVAPAKIEIDKTVVLNDQQLNIGTVLSIKKNEVIVELKKKGKPKTKVGLKDVCPVYNWEIDGM